MPNVFVGAVSERPGGVAAPLPLTTGSAGVPLDERSDRAHASESRFMRTYDCLRRTRRQLTRAAAATQATLLPDVQRLFVETDTGPTWIQRREVPSCCPKRATSRRAPAHSPGQPAGHAHRAGGAEAARESRPGYPGLRPRRRPARPARRLRRPRSRRDVDQGPAGQRTAAAGRMAHHRTRSTLRTGCRPTLLPVRVVGQLQAWMSALEKVVRSRYQESTQPAGPEPTPGD